MAINPKLAARLRSPLVLFLFAALLAGIVAMIAYAYLQKREEFIKADLTAKSRKASAPRVNVVVPRTDVAAGSVLNNVNFVSRPIEDDLVYPDTLLAKDFPSMVGMKLARPVLRGRPVRASDLQQPVVNDVASILPPGTRAMTIDIDNLNSIAQTLRPHHHVDIFLLSKAAKPASGGPQVEDRMLEQASLFMQDMVVLATGKEFQDVSQPAQQTAKMVRPGDVEGARDTGFDSITLLVRPEQAAKLMVGQKMGTFRVVLRGVEDRHLLALKPLRAGDLMPAARSQRDAGIEFIVGGRGDNIISRVPVPPSQATVQAALAALQANGNGAVATAATSPAAPPAAIQTLRGTK